CGTGAGATCVNTMTSTDHCGGCSTKAMPRACTAGQTCMGGACSGGTPAPANDNCATPTMIDLASGPSVTVPGTTVGATHSANSCAPGGDVFYRFTLTRREIVYADTFGAAFDTQVGFLAPGCGAPALECADNACGTMQSQVARVLDAGTWLLVVDGNGSAAGTFALRVQHLPVGSGAPERLMPLAAGTLTLRGATAGTGVLATSCGTGAGPENTHWFTTCQGASALDFRATTCLSGTWDTVLEQRSAGRMPLALCNDDDSTCTSTVRSTLTGTIPAGPGLHAFYVDGFNGTSSGDYEVRTTLTTPGGCAAGTTACGTMCCTAAQVCVAGACTSGPTCTAPMMMCGGTCADTGRDPMNCGACGRPCFPPMICSGGVCGSGMTCTGSLVSCGGLCVDLQSDPSNCGACTVACPAGQTCTSGVCRASGCTAPTRLCGGMCVDTGSHLAHCGACDRACPTGQGCGGGTCSPFALSASEASRTALVGNASGGTMFNELCPAGSAIVGFEGMLGDSYNLLAMYCQQLVLAFPGGTPAVTLDGFDRRLSFRGGPGGRTPVTGHCPANQVLVGFAGSAGSLLDSLSLRCAPVTATVSGGRLVLGFGTISTMPPVGGTGGRPFSAIDCPSGQFAGGAAIRAGGAIDAFGLVCHRLVSTP
ncbi:MAG: hypothetical protein HY909_30655, partial [Deltaproteobacteria bacterium]|nr:hypothetical protein [Deltaproteobacteria bacterium]